MPSFRTDMDCRLRALGMVNALGASPPEIFSKLLRGSQDGLVERGDLIPGSSIVVGQVGCSLPALSSGLEAFDSRNARLLLAAFLQIAAEVEDIRRVCGSHRIGVVIGTSTSGIHVAEDALRHRAKTGCVPRGYDYTAQEIGTAADVIAEHARLAGPTYTVSTACSSSAKVFRSGRALLRAGICDGVIVGGADSLCRLTVNGFKALELLSPRVTNPFSKNRNGITIGEGACLTLLTKESGGVQLLGVGESSDAHHVSAPDPEAVGAITAISSALCDAQLSAADVSYVNLHGTGTVHNDAMEARAIHAIFGGAVPCSSTKPLAGHLLGASGATEIGFCWMLLNNLRHSQLLPPHVYDGESDPELAPVQLVETGQVVQSNHKIRMLSNSFGFGGSNCAVVLGTEKE